MYYFIYLLYILFIWIPTLQYLFKIYYPKYKIDIDNKKKLYHTRSYGKKHRVTIFFKLYNYNILLFLFICSSKYIFLKLKGDIRAALYQYYYYQGRTKKKVEGSKQKYLMLCNPSPSGDVPFTTERHILNLDVNLDLCFVTYFLKRFIKTYLL